MCTLRNVCNYWRFNTYEIGYLKSKNLSNRSVFRKEAHIIKKFETLFKKKSGEVYPTQLVILSINSLVNALLFNKNRLLSKYFLLWIRLFNVNYIIVDIIKFIEYYYYKALMDLVKYSLTNFSKNKKYLP